MVVGTWVVLLTWKLANFKMGYTNFVQTQLIIMHILHL